MKDAEYVETNEKSTFRFLFFELWSLMYLKLHQFSMNFHDNAKNENRKIDFLFDSAHFAYFIIMGAKLRGVGVCIFLVGKKPTYDRYQFLIKCMKILHVASENFSELLLTY